MRHAILALALAAACTNPEVPAGHEGYVYHIPLVVGQMEHRQTLRGPSSTGLSWRLFITNIDMRAKSYTEDFELLSSDNLSVTFQVSTRIELRPGASKDIVERWGGVNWYAQNVKEPARTTVRRQAMLVSAVDIQLKTDQLKTRIYENLVERFKDMPLNILTVNIGNIHFPKEVTDAIQAKIAKQQELERQEFILAKTRKEAAIRVLEALRVAEQQRIISTTLDPLYVQRKAVEVYRLLASSPNKTILVLPQTDNATAMPLVLASGARKVLSPADEQLLKEMEERYMKRATENPTEIQPGPIPTGPAVPKTAPVVPTATTPAPAAPATPTPAPPAPAAPAPANP